MSGTMKIKDSGNIFEVVYSIEAKVLSDPVAYSAPEYARLFKAIKFYFNEGLWAHNDKEKKIYMYSGKNLKTAYIAERLHMNINTYRSNVSRISSRIRASLFDGADVYTAILASSPIELRKLCSHIEFLNVSFDIYDELDADLLKGINDKRESSPGVVISDEDYYEVLDFLCAFSKKAVQSRLSHLNPVALDYVMNELASPTYKKAMTHYKAIQRDIAMKPKQIKENYIKAANALTGGTR